MGHFKKRPERDILQLIAFHSVVLGCTCTRFTWEPVCRFWHSSLSYWTKSSLIIRQYKDKKYILVRLFLEADVSYWTWNELTLHLPGQLVALCFFLISPNLKGHTWYQFHPPMLPHACLKVEDPSPPSPTLTLPPPASQSARVGRSQQVGRIVTELPLEETDKQSVA